FITFSPAEIDWLELIVVLVKSNENQDITMDDAKKLTRDKRIELVIKRPVNNDTVEEEVEITTQSDQIQRLPKEVPIKYQIHTHRGNCKMENKELGYIYCKYGYPMPILDETIILKPIDAKSDGYEMAFQNYMKIRKKLEEADSLWRNKKEETTLANGLLFHYTKRPQTMKTVCLAEFACYYDFVSNEKFKQMFNKNKVERFPEDEDEIDDDYNEVNFNLENNDLTQSSQSNSSDDDVVQITQTPSQLIDQTTNQCTPQKKGKDKSDYIKLKDGDGYVVLRQKSKVLRYKRYNKLKDEQNYMRVLIMLYMPWYDEKKQVEVTNLLRALEENRQEIVVNRAKFESIVSENFDKAQEEIEKEINEFYEQLMENEVQQLDDASDNLARNYIHDGSIREMDDEEAEENF
ncbi:ATP-dependent DNA helicase, partial [Brachionus plicatilis]